MLKMRVFEFPNQRELGCDYEISMSQFDHKLDVRIRAHHLSSSDFMSGTDTDECSDRMKKLKKALLLVTTMGRQQNIELRESFCRES